MTATPSRPSWTVLPLIWLVALYRRLISPLLPAIFGPSCACRFHPSCSHYATEALIVHGPLKGTWLGLTRFLRCTPLSAGGFDPVPARPRCERVA